MKVEVRVHELGERGLFAKMDIKKGEFIAILPIDYIQISGEWYTLNPVNKGPINFRYGIPCDIVVPKEDDNLTVMGTFKNFLKGHRTRSSVRIELVGVSNHQLTEGIFVGHMINDLIDMSLISRDRYENLSKSGENVLISTDLELFRTVGSGDNRLGLKVIAKKNIKKGKELFWSYGESYWKTYSNKDVFEISPNIELIGADHD